MFRLQVVKGDPLLKEVAMYDWRKMTDQERRQVLASRRARGLPWHSPPHRHYDGEWSFLITAACYEHVPIIGKSPQRMEMCEQEVLEVCRQWSTKVFAWCILPNHYHALVRTEHIAALRYALGRFHGRSSFLWNGEDETRGRKVWHNCFESPIKSERHFFASLNYVHHNPVKHGYVIRWQDWPFSSAGRFCEEVGRQKAEELWRAYPILDYGEKWDV